jgi:glycosyltransferase involved in cell wall biosynthesis
MDHPQILEVKPKISVIMPAYNAGKYIREAIQSILNQTHTDFELLICDDCSTDDSIETIRSFTDSRIQFFQNSRNKGNLETSNFLFQKCRGEFITIQDADDWSEKNRLELQLAAFQANSELGLVGINYMLVDDQKNPIRCGYYPLTDKEIKAEMKENLPPFVCAGVMVRKSISDKVGYYRAFFNRIGSADYDWIARISENTKVENIRSVLYFYRVNPTSFTKSTQPKNYMKLYAEKIALFLMKQRQINGTDALDSGKFIEIKHYLSKLIREESEHFYWNNNIEKALEKAKLAITVDFFSIKNWRNFIYIRRSILVNK